MAFAVKAVIDKVARDGGLEAGDTFLFNDPYDGGTHLNDFRLVRPIFRDGRLFCWLASVGHWLDIGGNVPGGYNPQATESFQEGVRFPPVKLFRPAAEPGHRRHPRRQLARAAARTGATSTGSSTRSISASGASTRFSTNTATGPLPTRSTRFPDRAEALMRAAIRALPDGALQLRGLPRQRRHHRRGARPSPSI